MPIQDGQEVVKSIYWRAEVMNFFSMDPPAMLVLSRPHQPSTLDHTGMLMDSKTLTLPTTTEKHHSMKISTSTELGGHPSLFNFQWTIMSLEQSTSQRSEVSGN